MAILNKNEYTIQLDKRIESADNSPVITTDEIGTSITVNELGEATGFTTLTEKVADIYSNIEDIQTSIDTINGTTLIANIESQTVAA